MDILAGESSAVDCPGLVLAAFKFRGPDCMLIIIIMMIGEGTGRTKDVLSTLISMPKESVVRLHEYFLEITISYHI